MPLTVSPALCRDPRILTYNPLHWDSGVGQSRVERSERYTAHSTTTVLFKASSGASSDSQTSSTREYLSRVRHAPQLPLGHAHVDDLSDHALDSGIIPPRGRHLHSWDEFHGNARPEHTDRNTVLQGQVPPYTPSSDYPVLDVSYLPHIQSASSTQLSNFENVAESPTALSHSSASTSRSSSSGRSDTHRSRRGRSIASFSNAFDSVKKHTARSLSPSTHRKFSLPHTLTADSDYSRLSISPTKFKKRNIGRLFQDARNTLSSLTRDVSIQSGCDTYIQRNSEKWETFQRGTSV